MSSASTPAPAGPSAAERASYLHTPKPFKNPNFAAKATGRKMRSLKQMVQMERDAAMGIETTVGKKKTKKVGLSASARSKARKAGTLTATATPTMVDSGTATPVGETDDQEPVDNADATLGPDTTMTSEAAGDTSMANASALGQSGDAAKAKRRRDLPTYMSFEAPPSLRPRKKFCDITGLHAPYTDPKTGLRYHSVEIYEVIKSFGPGVDQAYLALRGDSSQIK